LWLIQYDADDDDNCDRYHYMAVMTASWQQLN